MNEKKRVISVQILFDDGEVRHYNQLTGMFNKSRNARKLYGFKNSEEWDEYVISWHSAIDVVTVDVPSVEVVETNKEDRLAAEELAKDPRFAGIADGRVYYRKPVPITAVLPDWINNLFDDINEGYGNGQH